MQRSLVFALILAFCGAIGAAWWFLRSDTPPPMPGSGPVVENHEPAAPDRGAVAAGVPAAGAATTVREAVEIRDPDLLSDPEIRAGLCGFKGRVVDAKKNVVADCGVRIYRGAMDSILPADFDLFAAEQTYTPNYVAGETRTAADGTWQVTGVWPRALYLLFAGIGTDAPMHQVLTRTPSPGEIVDLGDIVLPDAGVIVGTVLDDNGDPLAGALVRAADLPGTLAAFFPVERFDPDGAVLIREPQAPVRVVEMPKWVKNAFEHLPIPSTRSDGEGRFRLVGVVPGSNMLATTANAFLSDVKPSVQVRAGQEKDVGKIRLKRGEEVIGKVLDSAGKPVADAEVLAGSTLSIAPVDLAQRLGHTDRDGKFQGQGFSAGKVTVAARRGKGHAWVLAEPQPIMGEVTVTLPATFAIEAAVTLADGKPATEARLQLLQGRAGDGAAELHLMGLVPPIDLNDRKKEVAEGRWRLENLNPGTYTLLADAPGHAAAFVVVDVTTTDTVVSLPLIAPKSFTVRVVDLEDKPIRNCAIVAEGRGKRVVEMPIKCGRTGSDGRLVIDKLTGESLRVSAEHPRWGVVHGEAKNGEELLLRMQPPGSLTGIVREAGKPPAPGKYTIAMLRQRGNDASGPLEQVPALLTPALDGTFQVKALQPGHYELTLIKSLEALRSPGGVMSMAQELGMMRDLAEQKVEIAAGQNTEVEMEAAEKPIEGPTARVTGSVTVDGKLAAGYTISTWGSNRRFTARVDERGRFDLGVVPAGDMWIQVMAGSEGMFFGSSSNLWSANIKLAEAEVRELTIEVQTSSIRGTCYGPDGAPVAGVFVQGQGKLKGDAQNGQVWLHASTNGNGEFEFPQVAAGTWTLNVRGNNRNAVRGQLTDLEVQGGSPVTGLRIDLQASVVVKGRVDLAVLGATKPEWAWLSFHRLAENDPPDAEGQWADGVGIDLSAGTFSTDDLGAGRFRVRLHAQTEQGQAADYPCDVLVVPPGGLADVVLRPGPRMQGK